MTRPARPSFKRKILASALLAAGSIAAFPASADSPRIVASIIPIHSLVTGLAGEIYPVDLLIPGSASPHGYAMRPSEARRLQSADLVVWVGPELETFLQRSLQQTPGREVISLMDDLELALLETRSAGVRKHGPHDGETEHEHDHDHEHEHEHGHGHGHGHEHDHDTRHNHEPGHQHEPEHDHDHDQGDEHDHNAEYNDAGGHEHGRYDAHLWLSPDVVRSVTTQLAEEMMEWDPARADRIAKNRDALLERIDALDTRLAAQLEPVREQAFMVFHDAYQYFEQHYGLNNAGSISLDPSRMPGPRRLSELRDRAQEGDVLCLFTEPQFRPDLAQTVAEGTGTHLGVMDPVGADLQPGPDAWFELMQGLADSFTNCMNR